MTQLVGQNGGGWTPVTANNQQNNGNAYYFRSGYLGSVGNADTAWFNFGTTTNTANFVKICLYDAGGNRIAVSAPLALVSNTLVSGSISASLTAQTYTLVVVPDSGIASCIVNNGSGGGANNQNTAANFSYSSPPATLPAADNSNGQEFIVYLTGSSGATLMGQACLNWIIMVGATAILGILGGAAQWF